MAFEDFIQQFKKIYICRLFDVEPNEENDDGSAEAAAAKATAVAAAMRERAMTLRTLVPVASKSPSLRAEPVGKQLQRVAIGQVGAIVPAELDLGAHVLCRFEQLSRPPREQEP